MDEVQRALGRIEGKLDAVGVEQRTIHLKLDRHLLTPHADPKEVSALLRFRWMVGGAVAALGALATALALV